MRAGHLRAGRRSRPESRGDRVPTTPLRCRDPMKAAGPSTAAYPARVRLNHHREGSGEPLVLIHGVGSQWQVWSPLIPLLAPHRDVIALDLPGFGESPLLPGGVEPDPYALTDAVVQFLDELGLERPPVVGNSLGGLIALELAR